MTVRVLLEMKAKPGTGNDLVAAFKSTLADTRAFEGCISIATLQNSDDADNLVLVEVWESREHHEKYLAWRRERGDIARRGEALAEPSSLRYFDLTEA